MSSVKIYTAVSEDLSPIIQGEGFCTDVVRYSDYAALEAKCAALSAELEAAEKRIAELTGKPANEYADDADLLFEIDFCDDLSTSIQVAQWLKELRIRRAAGIITKVGG